MDRRRERAAGWLLILGTVWTVAAIYIAESLTPNYSLRGEAISGLGSTYFATIACIAGRCNDIYQPASLIFVASGVVTGALLLFTARNLSHVPGKKQVARLIALMGAGTLVLSSSYLPLYMGETSLSFYTALALHFASSIFLVGVAAFLALRADVFAKPWQKLTSRTMGVVIVVAVPLYTYMAVVNSLWGPGFGGVERIGFYTIFLWFVMYGVYLLNASRRS
ncbi:DUF998 domain-containing protein [Candidatus Kaiserbacteria bacterium]|nr:DUF998 domain-containing protein [Candidatus Kaiserbacteria bacterium]